MNVIKLKNNSLQQSRVCVDKAIQICSLYDTQSGDLDHSLVCVPGKQKKTPRFNSKPNFLPKKIFKKYFRRFKLPWRAIFRGGVQFDNFRYVKKAMPHTVLKVFVPSFFCHKNYIIIVVHIFTGCPQMLIVFVTTVYFTASSPYIRGK